MTLTGAGGSGKTRLAVAVASLAAPYFPGGVAFAPLESVREAEVLWPVIRKALGLKGADGQPLLEALADHLGTRPPVLLVLDNLEQLDAAARHWLAELLDHCTTLTILVTSRGVLHLYGEHELQVPPLALSVFERVPLALDALGAVPAVALFVQRARAADAAFGLSAANADAVAKLCHALDGLPLAIELAAARIKRLTPQAMLTRMRSAAEMDTIGAPASDRPQRQRTLRATLAWSHALLEPAEQRLFRRLGIFGGGWTLESAEGVCNCRRDLGIDILDGIASLLDKNLVRRIDSAGEARFAMLNTVRAYALEQLEANADDLALMRRALAAWCLVVAEEQPPADAPDEEARWFDACEAEQENIHAAFDALLGTDQGEWALRLSVAIMRYWMARERQAEGRLRLEAALALPSAAAPTALRALACGYAGAINDNQGQSARAGVLHEESLAIWRLVGDRRGQAGQLNTFALWACRADDLELACSTATQAVALCRELGDDEAVGWALTNLAQFESASGETAHARKHLDEALEIFGRLGRHLGVAWCRNHLADLARVGGHWAEARSNYNEAAAVFRRLGPCESPLMASAIRGFGGCEECHLQDTGTGHRLSDLARLHGSGCR